MSKNIQELAGKILSGEITKVSADDLKSLAGSIVAKADYIPPVSPASYEGETLLPMLPQLMVVKVRTSGRMVAINPHGIDAIAEDAAGNCDVVLRHGLTYQVDGTLDTLPELLGLEIIEIDMSGASDDVVADAAN